MIPLKIKKKKKYCINIINKHIIELSGLLAINLSQKRKRKKGSQTD